MELNSPRAVSLITGVHGDQVNQWARIQTTGSWWLRTQGYLNTSFLKCVLHFNLHFTETFQHPPQWIKTFTHTGKKLLIYLYLYLLVVTADLRIPLINDWCNEVFWCMLVISPPVTDITKFGGFSSQCFVSNSQMWAGLVSRSSNLTYFLWIQIPDNTCWAITYR